MAESKQPPRTKVSKGKMIPWKDFIRVDFEYIHGLCCPVDQYPTAESAIHSLKGILGLFNIQVDGSESHQDRESTEGKEFWIVTLKDPRPDYSWVDRIFYFSEKDHVSSFLRILQNCEQLKKLDREKKKIEKKLDDDCDKRKSDDNDDDQAPADPCPKKKHYLIVQQNGKIDHGFGTMMEAKSTAGFQSFAPLPLESFGLDNLDNGDYKYCIFVDENGMSNPSAKPHSTFNAKEVIIQCLTELGIETKNNEIWKDCFSQLCDLLVGSVVFWGFDLCQTVPQVLNKPNSALFKLIEEKEKKALTQTKKKKKTIDPDDLPVSKKELTEILLPLQIQLANVNADNLKYIEQAEAQTKALTKQLAPLKKQVEELQQENRRLKKKLKEFEERLEDVDETTADLEAYCQVMDDDIEKVSAEVKKMKDEPLADATLQAKEDQALFEAREQKLLQIPDLPLNVLFEVIVHKGILPAGKIQFPQGYFPVRLYVRRDCLMYNYGCCLAHSDAVDFNRDKEGNRRIDWWSIKCPRASECTNKEVCQFLHFKDETLDALFKFWDVTERDHHEPREIVQGRCDFRSVIIPIPIEKLDKTGIWRKVVDQSKTGIKLCQTHEFARHDCNFIHINDKDLLQKLVNVRHRRHKEFP